jgi:hypothetical protein
MLKFRGRWRFHSPGTIDRKAVEDVITLVNRIATQGDQQSALEHFKRYFAKAAGMVSNRSSSAGWAESDLRDYMRKAAENAP